MSYLTCCIDDLLLTSWIACVGFQFVETTCPCSARRPVSMADGLLQFTNAIMAVWCVKSSFLSLTDCRWTTNRQFLQTDQKQPENVPAVLKEDECCAKEQ